MHKEVSRDKAHFQREITFELNPEEYTGVSQAVEYILGRLRSSRKKTKTKNPAALLSVRAKVRWVTRDGAQAKARSGRALNILAGSSVFILKAKGIRITLYKEQFRWVRETEGAEDHRPKD